MSEMQMNQDPDSTTAMLRLIPHLVRAQNYLNTEDWERMFQLLKNLNDCPRCGNPAHAQGRCPARGRKCNCCGKLGHFAAVCLYQAANARVPRYCRVQSPKLNLPVGTTVAVRDRDTKLWILEGTVIQHGQDQYRVQLNDGSTSWVYPWFVKEVNSCSVLEVEVTSCEEQSLEVL